MVIGQCGVEGRQDRSTNLWSVKDPGIVMRKLSSPSTCERDRTRNIMEPEWAPLFFSRSVN